MSLELIKDTTEYRTFLGDIDNISLAEIKVGGSDDKFVPNINVSKWNDEAWINLNWKDLIVNQEKEQFSNNIVELVVDNVIYRNYTLKNSVLEVEIIFLSEPSTNKINFEVQQSSNLRWNYQTKYISSWNPEIDHMPENVEGSYAIYFNKNHGIYKTGKFCHLYAWEVIDAIGNKIHIPLQYKDKILTIEIPQWFLETAQYPIKIMGKGDTIGCTSVGAITWNMEPGHIIVWSNPTLCQTTSGGTIDKSSIYLQETGSPDHCAVIYLDDGGEPGTRHSYGNTLPVPNPAAWVDDENYPVSGSDSIVQDTIYWFGGHFENGYFYYDFDFGNGNKARYYDVGNYGTPPATWDTGADVISNERIASIYITYIGGETIQIGNASILDSGQALVINAQEMFGISNASIADAGQTLIANVSTMLSVANASISLAAKALKVNEAIKLTNATISVAGQALVANIHEIISISNASLSLVGKALKVNEIIKLANASISVAGQALNVLAAETIQISNALISLTGQALTVIAGNVVQIANATIALTGKALKVNEAIQLGKANINAAGQAIVANAKEIVGISNAGISLVGKALKVNEAVKIGKATISLVGKSMTVAGEVVGKYIDWFLGGKPPRR